jgi:hypothetical protein
MWWSIEMKNEEDHENFQRALTDVQARQKEEIEESRETTDTLYANRHQVTELDKFARTITNLGDAVPQTFAEAFLEEAEEDRRRGYAASPYARRFGMVLGRLMTIAGQLEAMKRMVRTSSPEIQKEVYHLHSIAQEMVDLQAGIDEARAKRENPRDLEDPHHDR